MIGSLIMGAIVGWIAGKLMNVKGGLLRNIIVGLVGSFVGGAVFGLGHLNGLGGDVDKHIVFLHFLICFELGSCVPLFFMALLYCNYRGKRGHEYPLI